MTESEMLAMALCDMEFWASSNGSRMQTKTHTIDENSEAHGQRQPVSGLALPAASARSHRFLYRARARRPVQSAARKAELTKTK
jgi:hypothetical protein